MEKIIQTPCGLLRGCVNTENETVAFKGIRYANAGRWEYPLLVTEWEGTYDATRYQNCSYQARAFYDEELNVKKNFYYKEFRKGETYSYSDDCLFLNIFAPKDGEEGKDYPVIFYIHGGSFTGGCGYEKHFDQPQWPRKNVIAVTINYRLGPMGFLCLKELEEEAGQTGNYGLYDQLAALQWVKNNIASFGGNPENITIMGQSAGAMSVQFHYESPLTRGLFQKAVLSSGCGMNSMMAGSMQKHMAFWKEVMKDCGCDTLEELRRIPAEKLFASWDKLKKTIRGGAMASFPVKDGKFITTAADKKNVPVMAGSTSHDMAPPILHYLTKKWCQKRQATGYVWYFDRMLPGDDNGAWHSSDLWYWFGTLKNCWRPMTEKDWELSNQMIAYLCRFAETGNPNHPDLPEWTDCNTAGSKVMVIGEKPTGMAAPSKIKMIHTLLTNKAVGE